MARYYRLGPVHGTLLPFGSRPWHAITVWAPSMARYYGLSPVHGTLLPFEPRPCHAITVWAPSMARYYGLSPVHGTLLRFEPRPWYAITVWVTIELDFHPRVTRLAIHGDSPWQFWTFWNNRHHFPFTATLSDSPRLSPILPDPPVLWRFHPANSPDHSRIITITSIGMKRHEKRHSVTTAFNRDDSMKHFDTYFTIFWYLYRTNWQHQLPVRSCLWTSRCDGTISYISGLETLEAFHLTSKSPTPTPPPRGLTKSMKTTFKKT